MDSNDSPEIPDRGETSDIPGLPSGEEEEEEDEEGYFFSLWQSQSATALDQEKVNSLLTSLPNFTVTHEKEGGGRKKGKLQNASVNHNHFCTSLNF